MNTWPKIKKTQNHGIDCYMVDARIAGKGERKFFPTKATAEGFAQTCRNRRLNEGSGGFDDKRLRAFGWSVTDAINFALAHLEKIGSSKPMDKVVEWVLEDRKPHVVASRFSDLKTRLGKFRDAVGAETFVAKVSYEMINDFLDTIPNASTRNDYRKEIILLWGEAYSKGWVLEPFDKKKAKRAPELEKARIVLSVDEAERLMDSSEDEEVRALNALVLFAGCRVEEVEKMDWRHIEFEHGHINITAEISKVRTERFAPINDTLRSWLAPIAKKKGAIVTRELKYAFRKVWKRAGIYPWPQDAHRHSFISYHRQLHGDTMTALNAGTSERIIKKHYKRPVTTKAAEAFFALRPKTSGKIISIAAA